MCSVSLCHQIERLSLGLSSPTQFVRTNHVNRSLINRLGLETCLQGHQGCVNCLEWNERGTYLASGSDDCCLILWDPFEHRSVFVLNTGHVGNIFSVKFLPNLNEYLIVTGAADAKVRVHDISRMETRHVFSCHSGRIKRLANTPSEPFLFWSAAEDGTVRQFDLRDASQASSARPSNVLVNLHNHIGSYAEAKCLALNPIKPELLAVGSNDPYARVYDRRKLTLSAFSQPVRLRQRRRFQPDSSTGVALASDVTTTLSADCVRYFVPGHLPCKAVSYRRCLRQVNVTCVCFSPDGEELLTNMGGDHIYMFNLNKHLPPYRCANTQVLGNNEQTGLLSAATSSARRLRMSLTPSQRSSHREEFHASCYGRNPSTTSLERASLQAARLVKAKAFVAAIRAYNELIYRWPSDPQLYTGRATALLKRGWNGDVYSALLDCQSTLSLTETDAAHSHTDTTVCNQVHKCRSNECIRVTALLLSARCLLRLDWVHEARVTLDKVLHHYSHLIHPTPSQTINQPKTDSSPSCTPSSGTGGNGFVRLVSEPTVSSSLDEPTLYKFFHLLDCEIRSKEAELEKTRTQQIEREKKAQECGDAEVVTNPSESTCDASQFLVSPKKCPSSQENDSIQYTGTTSDTGGTAPGVNVSSPDLPDIDPGNNPDESWPPTWFTSHDLNASDDNEEHVVFCSCIGCVTRQYNSENKMECTWRGNASDYTKRFVGHCNAITDIKEASFFGSNAQYIVGGSDCGSFFVWDRDTTNTVRIMEADSSTVNCVQPHPSICLLASSGIDSVVRLWSPRSEDDANMSLVVKDHVGAAERNQRRSVVDPLEIMLLNMGYRIPGLDVGFSRRRRPRRRSSAERSSHDSHERERSNESDGDEIEMESRMNRLLGEAQEEEEDIFPAEHSPDDYSNSEDLDGLPEIPGAVVFTSDISDSHRSVDFIDRNGVSQTNTPQTESAEQRDPCVFPRRGRGRSSRVRESANSGFARHKCKRLRSDSTAILQPSVALSAFDDDSCETDSGSEPPDTNRSRPTTDTRHPAAPNRETGTGRPSDSSFVALRSLLPNGNHFVVYGAPTSSETRHDHSQSENVDSTDNANPGDSAVLEIPCTMS